MFGIINDKFNKDKVLFGNRSTIVLIDRRSKYFDKLTSKSFWGDIEFINEEFFTFVKFAKRAYIYKEKDSAVITEKDDYSKSKVDLIFKHGEDFKLILKDTEEYAAGVYAKCPDIYNGEFLDLTEDKAKVVKGFVAKNVSKKNFKRVFGLSEVIKYKPEEAKILLDKEIQNLDKDGYKIIEKSFYECCGEYVPYGMNNENEIQVFSVVVVKKDSYEKYKKLEKQFDPSAAMFYIKDKIGSVDLRDEKFVEFLSKHGFYVKHTTYGAEIWSSSYVPESNDGLRSEKWISSKCGWLDVCLAAFPEYRKAYNEYLEVKDKALKNKEQKILLKCYLKQN